MRVGVHCSVRHGFAAALDEAAALGCETLQIFTQSPRGWRTRVFTDEEFSLFRERRRARGIDPVVVHTPYLPNLCTAQPDLYRRSCRALLEDLDRCERLGADYLVIHPGAYSPGEDLAAGLDRMGEALNRAFDEAPGRTRVLIENMAGGGRRIGGPFREVGELLARVRDARRVGVCFDTCHAYGAGYDLPSPEGLERALEEFDREVGLSRIAVFHVNDSRAPRGSHRDMHEHIGRGHLGAETFRRLLARPAFRDAAFILETPRDSVRADLRNIAALRGCLS
jgi:deoxyribonuclease-4